MYNFGLEIFIIFLYVNFLKYYFGFEFNLLYVCVNKGF